MARSMLRGSRVAAKQELIDRIHLYFEQIDADPVILSWKYKWRKPALHSFQQNDDLVRMRQFGWSRMST